MWTPIYSWYDYLPYAGKGLMVGNRPWDGSYSVSATVWVTAHTTQFTEPGWYYLGGSAAALLPGGGSYVSIAPADGSQLSVIIETVGANASQTLELLLKGSFATVTHLHRWITNESHQFMQGTPVEIGENRMISLDLEPNIVCTLSTTTGQQKGGAEYGASVGTQRPFPFPYSETFDGYPDDTLPKFWSDMHGAFAVAITAGDGAIYRQQGGTVPPLCTHGRGATAYATIIGDTSLSRCTYPCISVPPAAIYFVYARYIAHWTNMLMPCSRHTES